MDAYLITHPTVEAVRAAWLKSCSFAGPTERFDAEQAIDALLAPIAVDRDLEMNRTYHSSCPVLNCTWVVNHNNPNHMDAMGRLFTVADGYVRYLS